MIDIEVLPGEPIRLGQFLKLAGAIEDGAMAREVIQSGEVHVNGAPETRRGRQLQFGDEVSYAGTDYLVALPQDEDQ